MAKKTHQSYEDTADLIKTVVKGDNVAAKEKLEKILKRKVARRTKETLAS